MQNIQKSGWRENFCSHQQVLETELKRLDSQESLGNAENDWIIKLLVFLEVDEQTFIMVALFSISFFLKDTKEFLSPYSG